MVVFKARECQCGFFHGRRFVIERIWVLERPYQMQKDVDLNMIG